MRPDDEIKKHFRLTKTQEAGLRRLGLATLRDLLYHFPSRHEEVVATKTINSLEVGEKVRVSGIVVSNKIKRAWRKKIPIAEMVIKDQTGSIKAVWYHQAYMAKRALEGARVSLTGVVTMRKSEIYLANPMLDDSGSSTPDNSLFTSDPHALTAKYPETRGLSSLWIATHIGKLITSGVHEKFDDPIPSDILKKYHLPGLATAMHWVHMPQKESDARAARKRFAFEEIFFIQLERQRARREYRSNPTFQIDIRDGGLSEFMKRFPFALTKAQDRAIRVILADLHKTSPMTRLLEGDVGSGKTAVAATVSYGVVTTRPMGQDFGNLQVAYMAPTEVLAKQLFESFIGYFKHLPIQIGLITGSGCYKFPAKAGTLPYTNISRAQLLKWVANGEIPILIGTHALIQKSVIFKHLALVIIDEQHRFGVNQRSKLVRKTRGGPTATFVPHLLSMTATPIPRTLALTIYGDLDLTLLDEMPRGRKQIITEIAEPNERENIYTKIRAELMTGRQVYVICPRIDEPNPTKEMALQAKSVKEEAKRLQNDIFPEYKIAILHSKMPPKNKDEIMQKFANNEIDILVATSVVEVGVNVPNATNIIIEGAERFGLSQLHQLRGRVLRSTHQAYCYLFSESKGKKSENRLKALVTAKNGFELSEEDLKQRGPGALAGASQWGISDIGMEAIQNLRMVEAARAEALAHPELTEGRLRRPSAQVHFE